MDCGARAGSRPGVPGFASSHGAVALHVSGGRGSHVYGLSGRDPQSQRPVSSKRGILPRMLQVRLLQESHQAVRSPQKTDFDASQPSGHSWGSCWQWRGENWARIRILPKDRGALGSWQHLPFYYDSLDGEEFDCFFPKSKVSFVFFPVP